MYWEVSRLCRLETMSLSLMLYVVEPSWSDHFVIAVEDYLHGLISVVNELVSYDAQISDT
jgi:hypothetical protein